MEMFAQGLIDFVRPPVSKSEGFIAPKVTSCCITGRKRGSASQP